MQRRHRARRARAAPRFEDTDWPEIVALYDILLRVDPSPVVALNRAIAVGMRDGPTAGLALIDTLLDESLARYPGAHAARADFLRRLGARRGARRLRARRASHPPARGAALLRGPILD